MEHFGIGLDALGISVRGATVTGVVMFLETDEGEEMCFVDTRAGCSQTCLALAMAHSLCILAYN